MLGDTMEAYVDDMLVKSRLGIDHGFDLKRVVAQMKLHNVRLNPANALLVLAQENPWIHGESKGSCDQPRELAINEMTSPTCHKEV